jgi:NADH:ubiquinone oxidoreductase subunit 4 (subunit M)
VTILAVWGAALIGAVYMLRAVRNILHGPLTGDSSQLRDASDPWRRLPFALLLASLLVFGFVPRLLTDKIKPSVETILTMATRAPAPLAQPTTTAQAKGESQEVAP